jgi:penicillin-binding protein 1A
MSLIVGITFGMPCWEAIREDPAEALRPTSGSIATDRHGEAFLPLSKNTSLSSLEYKDLPRYMVDALVAREDSRFWSHWGVDVIGFARALATNVASLRFKQGASTLTMQLVEHSYERSQKGAINRIQNKVFEWIMSFRVEYYAKNKFTERSKGKQAILASYCNRVGFGHGTGGLVEAAKYYFKKKPHELTLGECAHLAGLLRAPTANSAYRNLENALLARDAVIARMLQLNLITDKQAKNAHFYVTTSPKAPDRKGDGFTIEMVRRELSKLEKTGLIPQNIDEQGNTEVVLTLDADFQHRVTGLVRSELSHIEQKPDFNRSGGQLEGAAVVLENATGAILAIVGGRDYSQQMFNCAVDGSREIASAIKPLIFANYVDLKPKPTQWRISNDVLGKTEAAGMQGNYNPHETSLLPTGKYSISDAIAYSSNRASLRAGAFIGWNRWNALIQQLHLTPSTLPKSTDIWIGSFPVSPLSAAKAYATIARCGSIPDPHLIAEVRQRELGLNRSLYVHHNQTNSIFSPLSCSVVHRGMLKVLSHGTASRYAKPRKNESIAGKTGTSSDIADVWFVGYTDTVTIAVWIGFHNNRNPIVRRGDAASIAYPLFEKIVRNLPEKFPAVVETH